VNEMLTTADIFEGAILIDPTLPDELCTVHMVGKDSFFISDGIFPTSPVIDIVQGLDGLNMFDYEVYQGAKNA
jgi:hypothetical protein